LFWAILEAGNLHRSQALAPHANLIGRGAREVNISSLHEGTAIGDFNDHRTAVGKVGDFDARA
jgi:hypothetical protein